MGFLIERPNGLIERFANRLKKAAIILLMVSVLAGVAGYLSVEIPIIIEEECEVEEGIVPYQLIFMQCAPDIGWDWTLLAAVAYHESRFHATAHSKSGAVGVMQLVPVTAHRFGLNDSTIWVPEDNIRAGVEYIKFLQGKWSFIQNLDEQTKFVLASYNVGPGFIFSARKEAQADGANPYVWDEVEPYVHSSATRHYVRHVLKTSKQYQNDYTER